ncbi:MAG: hypothetical protein ABID54_10905 [Pseudomonadota bacterium]
MNPFVSWRNLLEQWGTHPGEQEGESQPEEVGRGKYSPPASPEKVTAEAVSEGIKGLT